MNPFVAHPKLQRIKELQNSKMFGFDFLITCFLYYCQVKLLLFQLSLRLKFGDLLFILP